ncbi:MAG: hypothetical protein V2A76_10005, partial [Planctomycetota bacterium]
GMYMVLTADLRSRANRYLSRAADASRVSLAGLHAARIQLGGNPGWTGGNFRDPDAPSQGVTVTASSTGVLTSRATCVGVVGDATQGISADLMAVPDPVLGFNLFSATTIELDNVTSGGYVRANGDITATGDLDFSGTVETLSGSSVTLQIESRQVHYVSETLVPPAVSMAFYASRASPMLGLPVDTETGAILLENISLRPDSNPYGATNPKGAYLIDAPGQKLAIRNVYVEGLLVVRGATHILIEQGFYLVRVDNGMASLVANAPIDLRLQNSLDESVSLIDFNGDGDLFDLFQPSIEGVVYSSSSFTGPQGGLIKGAVVANQIHLTGMPDLRDSSALATQPVYEFTEPGPWDVVAGSIGRTP